MPLERKIMFLLWHKSSICPLLLVICDKLVGTLKFSITEKDASFTVGNGGFIPLNSALIKQFFLLKHVQVCPGKAVKWYN